MPTDTVENVIETEQVASEIQAKIKRLCDFEGEDLKEEMMTLKASLLRNPSACSLLHNTDIGEAVKALKRMTGVAIAAATAGKAKKPSATKAAKTSLAKALAEVTDDDF